MINLTDLLGREGAAGLAVYLVVAHGAAGTLAQRHIDKKLVPQCMAGHVADSKATRFKTTGEHALDMTADALKAHGGQAGQMFSDLLKMKSAFERSVAAKNAAAGASTCSCRLKLAAQKVENRLAWTAFVASWKLLDDAPAVTLATAATIDADASCKGSAP